ncbi:MAG: zinc ribbon domain-containing protein [Clostridia bacterium]|nr:zinc ribbon domain-containing protein [Clostridia bacterium]
MSVFKRANWHSGLTYRQVCSQCKTVVEYDDKKLGFRPWYPDGFVYCPTCQTPLRHNERHAINAPASDTATPNNNEAKFCTSCGHKFLDGDKFCSQCGAKR